VAAYHMTHLMASHHGMCYMRTHRPDVSFLYDTNAKFEIGGANTIVDGSDIAIFSTGYMVHVCREAVEALAQKGVKCRLVDAYSFPMQEQPVLDALAKCRGGILVAEDNFIGGLASAVAEVAARHNAGRVESLTCNTMPKSGRTPEDLLAMVGVSVADIVRRASEMLK